MIYTPADGHPSQYLTGLKPETRKAKKGIMDS